MSNTEPAPAEMACGDRTAAVENPGRSEIEILTAREVPLGGPRAMRVRRTLPQRKRSLIGAWCFADHYGPDDVARTGGMDVPPHPHTGLQTVSWLFSGEVEHRDSLGTHATVRTGELNIMTGGYGVCHSEVSTPGTAVLHGVQLWVALPEAHRNAPRDFQHHTPASTDLGGASARVFLGTLAGATSPVGTFTPLLGAELTLAPHARTRLEVDPGFEHGILVDTGTVVAAGTELAATELGYAATGAAELELANPTEEPARALLLGGAPFHEEILMWWNFVGRSHDEIVAFRDAWQQDSDRFGRVEGYTGVPGRLPAPPLPNARIKPRRNARPADQPTTVERVDDRNRYEIRVGGRTVGSTAYRDRGGQRVFHHTEIDEAFSGRGLSSTLVAHALADTRGAGRRIVPVCPFVAAHLKKHGGFRDVTDPVSPEILQWVRDN